MENDANENATLSPAKTSPAGEFMDALFKRASELQESGAARSVALNTAELEYRIAHWPAAWGDDYRVVIYGDFDAPDHDLEYPALGITIEAGRRTDTIIKTALCVLNARVKVNGKNVSAVFDAFSRLNTFVGIWAINNWGNRAIGWWSHLTNSGMGSLTGPFEQEGIERVVAALETLPPKAKQKVRAALYWIREPKLMLDEQFKNDTMRVYAGYWNAFECLVEAVCQIHPLKKLNRQEKQDGITKFLFDREGKLDVESLRECYASFVDPGLAAKASHALLACHGKFAAGYIHECFRVKPETERLYNVRNAINHGSIDCDNPIEMYRVADKLSRLQVIVLATLGCLIPFSCPIDPGLKK